MEYRTKTRIPPKELINPVIWPAADINGDGIIDAKENNNYLFKLEGQLEIQQDNNFRFYEWVDKETAKAKLRAEETE